MLDKVMIIISINTVFTWLVIFLGCLDISCRPHDGHHLLPHQLGGNLPPLEVLVNKVKEALVLGLSFEAIEGQGLGQVVQVIVCHLACNFPGLP